MFTINKTLPEIFNPNPDFRVFIEGEGGKLKCVGIVKKHRKGTGFSIEIGTLRMVAFEPRDKSQAQGESA